MTILLDKYVVDVDSKVLKALISDYNALDDMDNYYGYLYDEITW
jgi:hypothetical protein